MTGWTCDDCGHESPDEHAPCSCDDGFGEHLDEIKRLRASEARLTAEVRRLSDDLERWRNAGICPNCGRGKFDEDGCCSTCGRDVIGFVDGRVVRPLPDAPDTGSRLSDVDAMAGRLKAIVGPLWSEAYCVEVANGLVGR